MNEEYGEQRRKIAEENPDYYFKSGKPKKKAMMCESYEYLAEIRDCNGYKSIADIPKSVCAGNRCPLYRLGCDKQYIRREKIWIRL